MNNANHLFTRHFALTLVLPLALAACGGEESSSIVASTNPQVAAALQLAKGDSAQLQRHGRVVLPAGAANVLVGLDLQRTGVLDASAVTTTRTRADGSYAITYQAKDAADAENFNTAALLAEIPGDQGHYTLSSPSGESEEKINPLTTLVYRKMLASATRSEAEQDVARQLDIPVVAIYRPELASVALAAASLTNYALKNGMATLTSPSVQAPDPTPKLVAFQFKDSHNYEYDVHTPEGSANAAGTTLWRPVYGGKINGNDRTQADAAYTASYVNYFLSTGREEYRQNGALQLFSPDNQFTALLQSREPTARLAESARKNAMSGYALETVVEKVDVSGRSMQAFFRDSMSYQLPLKDVVHLHAFTMEDPGLLQDAVFPEGSVLHVQLRTSIGSKDHITYTKLGQHPDSYARSSRNLSLEPRPWSNDLHPAQETPPADALLIKYALNERAWAAIKAALNLP